MRPTSVRYATERRSGRSIAKTPSWNTATTIDPSVSTNTTGHMTHETSSIQDGSSTQTSTSHQSQTLNPATMPSSSQRIRRRSGSPYLR
jgi:hypothetical protein